MKLSIIVPVYNVENYISQCLDSLLDQDFDQNDYEIIIINDGSIDRSLEISQNYANLNSQIKLINKKNEGVASARNCGMNAANGKYIYFIDSDDYLLPNSLKKLVDTCDQHDLDILTFVTTSFSNSASGAETISKNQDVKISFGENEFSNIVTGEDYVANVNYRNEVWWFVVNRQFLKSTEIGFTEGRWLEDGIFSIQLLLKAERIAHLYFDIHRHRFAPETAMTSIEPVHYLKVIRDLQHAALVFDPIIKDLENRKVHPECIKRIKARQQSFVFFSMMRILKSTMKIEEVKQRMNEMTDINAFPLDSFLGKDYNGLAYQFLVRTFNTKSRFYFFFQLLNPLLKRKYKASNQVLTC